MTMLTNFSVNEDFFAVFRTRLTNVLVDGRANIKQQTWTVGPFQELIFSVCMCVTKKWADHITQGRPNNPTGLFTFKTARSETPDNVREITFRLTNVIPERIIFVSRGITVIHWTALSVIECIASEGRVTVYGEPEMMWQEAVVAEFRAL
jgi:hypothetical protein